MTCENFSISKLARISDANTDFGLDIGPPLSMQRNILFWNSLFHILFVSSLHAASRVCSRHCVTTSSPLPVLNVF